MTPATIVLWLLVLEGAVVTSAGAAVGLLVALGAQALAGPVLQARFGILLQMGLPAATQWAVLAAVFLACTLGLAYFGNLRPTAARGGSVLETAPVPVDAAPGAAGGAPATPAPAAAPGAPQIPAQ